MDIALAVSAIALLAICNGFATRVVWSRKYRDAPDPGDDFATSRQVGRSIQSTADD